MFEPLLCPAWMAGLHGDSRNRSFNPSTTFWAWTDQILDANASCSKAVSLVQTWCAEKGRGVPSSATGAYCQARLRLTEAFLGQIHHRLVQSMTARTRAADLWNGMTVKAIDCSSVQLLDTTENQAVYPQPTTQKPGCGFPVMAIAGVLDLSSSAWIAMSPARTGTSDTTLAAELMDHFKAGDLVLADRAFNSYEMVSLLKQQGAECLMRLHPGRHRALDWRKGKKLGSNERLVVWNKPVQKPRGSTLSDAAWDQLPATMSVRLIRFGYENRAGEKAEMVLMTTLTDPASHPWVGLSDLYALRWDIEVKLRDLKTTLRMERFEVRSPEMARKTLLMVMIASNLVRSMVQHAAVHEGLPVAALSFKGSLDLLHAWRSRYRGRHHHRHKLASIHSDLLQLIATKRIDHRPFRHEPRAVNAGRNPSRY